MEAPAPALVHFEVSEVFTGEGRATRLMSRTACGLITDRQAELAWSPKDVTCPLCHLAMPPDFRQYA